MRLLDPVGGEAGQGKARDLPQSQGDTRRWSLGEAVHMC